MTPQELQDAANEFPSSYGRHSEVPALGRKRMVLRNWQRWIADLEKLEVAYGAILTGRIKEALGDGGFSGEELESLRQEPELLRIAQEMSSLERQIRKARAELDDDGTEPPF